uniref:Uncharacterized protein n=1 Tax=Knipowitschia caucasica TaxID=637954 RepID=A0AAV2KDE5_KNICA
MTHKPRPELARRPEPASGTAHSWEIWVRSARVKIQAMTTFSSGLGPQPWIHASFSFRGAGSTTHRDTTCRRKQRKDRDDAHKASEETAGDQEYAFRVSEGSAVTLRWELQ